MQSGEATNVKDRATVWRAALSGFCSMLVGIGFGRFAYTPLIPAIVAAGWFSPGLAVYLGATNLAGYLGGAVLARPILRFAKTSNVLRLAMVTATASFFACSSPVSFGWYTTWRFTAGVAGGLIMVLAGPAVLFHTPPARRGRVGGVIFTGVGIGIAASGTLIPVLLRHGLVGAWRGLGILSALLTLVAWRGWPPDVTQPRQAHSFPPKVMLTRPLVALLVTYGLNGIGLVPHMVFFVDFVSRGLGRGLASGASYWVLYGIGACAGSFLTGSLADRVGFRRGLYLALLLQGLGAALPAISSSAPVLMISVLIMGALTPGIATIVLGRVHELVGPRAHGLAWRWSTTAFAVMQAASGYGMSFVFARSGQYQALFEIGALAFALGLGLQLLTGKDRGLEAAVSR